MENKLLNNQDVFPTDKVVEDALKDCYPVFDELMQTIKGANYGLNAEWNYYKDGKSWLCKVTYKKKTVFWLSVWDKYFKIGFYFNEQSGSGIESLDIDNKLKESFKSVKPIGKLIPLEVNVESKNQINDILKIIDYKKSLK
jgi:hypothetical protein